jgi:hypothetical protein
VRHRFDYSQLRILPPRKQIVEVTLPIGVGARANEGLAVDQEGGRAAHPAIGALAIIGRDPRRLLVAVEALPELADVELKLLGIAQERLEILDITAAPAARRGASNNRSCIGQKPPCSAAQLAICAANSEPGWISTSGKSR